jgi:hypothetical protein
MVHYELTAILPPVILDINIYRRPDDLGPWSIQKAHLCQPLFECQVRSPFSKLSVSREDGSSLNGKYVHKKTRRTHLGPFSTCGPEPSMALKRPLCCSSTVLAERLFVTLPTMPMQGHFVTSPPPPCHSTCSLTLPIYCVSAVVPALLPA